MIVCIIPARKDSKLGRQVLESYFILHRSRIVGNICNELINLSQTLFFMISGPKKR